MCVNPFADRFDIHVELTDKTDMNMLEEYLCFAVKNNRLYSLTVVICTDEEKLNRMKQFCQARTIMFFGSPEVRNHALFDIRTEPSVQEKYKDKCFVIDSHLYMDDELNIYPCSICKLAQKPISSVKEYLEQKNEFEKLNKEYEESKDQELQKKLIDFINEIQVRGKKYVEDNINASGVCAGCKEEYHKYNLLLMVLNEYNDKFDIA